MKNKPTPTDPFNLILDVSAEESYNLYRVIKSLLVLPSFYDEYEYCKPDGMIYSCAFAFICQDYLSSILEINVLEDFDLLVSEMKFEEVFEEQEIEFKGKLEQYVRNEITIAEKEIKEKIELLFNSNDLLLRLFASLQNDYNDGDYTGALNFVRDNFNTTK